MKKIVILIFVTFNFIQFLDAQTPSGTIAFEEKIHNFGTILEQKGKVSHTFVFQNKGRTDITINDVHSTCGCIGKVVSKGPVKPGAKGKLVITFDPGYKSGFFSKEIVVMSNNSKDYNRIWVEGTITPTEHPVEEDYPYNFGNGLYLRLKVMAFGYLKPGETREMQLHYANATDKEMNLQFITDGRKEGLRFNNPGKIGPKAKGVLTFTYTMPATAADDVVFRLSPFVNNKKLAESLEVKILNDKKPDLK
jgi:hypothetical protein